MKKLIITGVLLMSAPLVAVAAEDQTQMWKDSSMYYGVQYASVTYLENNVPTLTPKTMTLRAGQKINKNLSFEGRAGFGMSGGSSYLNGYLINVYLNSYFGIYALGTIPVNDSIELYGLGGFTTGNLSATAQSGSSYGVAIATATGGSFGAGLNFAVSKNTKLNMEYTRYLTGSNWSVSALSFGASFSY